MSAIICSQLSSHKSSFEMKLEMLAESFESSVRRATSSGTTFEAFLHDSQANEFSSKSIFFEFSKTFSSHVAPGTAIR